jgi:ribosomal protein L24E
MNLMKSLQLMQQYSNCQKCGNGNVGNGEGKLIVENDYFFRSCKCGWKIKTDQDGRPID